MNASQNRLHSILQNKNTPILLLLAVNLIVGLLTFQDYALSLDEPLFYGYADAVGYAYSPVEWFSGEFDMIHAYGPSPGDHANRGPAYLLLTRTPARLLQNASMDYPSAWHLVNFLAFQIGVYFFYIFCLRWMRPWAAFAATALLSTQPILWEHAFINPKDPPFLAFFLITLELGFRMADRLANPQPGETRLQTLKHILLPAILLGLTVNIRVLGPLAAALAGLYFLSLRKPARIWWYLPYGVIAYAVMVITWPYLWSNPIGKFIEVVRFMSYNPTTLQVHFLGDLYRANELPRRYLPTMMFITLTEPVWPLAGLGLIIALIKRKSIEWRTLAPTLGWFIIPMVYVLLKQPPMYDGFRHFLFIAPPLFVLGGIALEEVFQRFRHVWVQAIIILALLLPGVIPGIRLHPYQYAYYNQFVGGTGQAAYSYETDYWLTCYKEAIQQLALTTEGRSRLLVKRGISLADYYAPKKIKVRKYQLRRLKPGDYALFFSRDNPALQENADNRKYIVRIQREGAVFCEIRQP